MEKQRFKYNDRVEFDEYFFGGKQARGSLRRGRIVGIISENIVDFWIVEMDDFLEGWDFKAISIPNTLLRSEGSNEKFACEAILAKV